MQSSNRKLFDSLVSRTKIYLVIIFVLLVVICIYNPKFIIPAILIFALILGYTYFANNKRKSEISQHLQDLTLNVNQAAKNSLIYSPIPLIIVETDGNIVWRSTKFVSEFANIDINNYLTELLENINLEIQERKDKKDKSIVRNLKIDNKEYKILGEFVKSGSRERKRQEKYMMILYFLDETENLKLQREYNDSKACVGIIMIDNYEETIQQIEIDERPQIIAEIEKSIYEWANEYEGIVVKSDRDRFVYLFEQRYLEKIKESKFNILDTIKEINTSTKVQLTLSIAISNEGETGKEKYQSALNTMDVVLGRGGDQAAIRENGKYNFFGGRVEEVERRTKVKARIVAHALEELIKENDQVLIMGHINPDIDALGSAIGMYRLATNLGKEAYIVANTDTMALGPVKASLDEENEFEGVIINKEIAEEKITDKTLLIIVDTHKSSYVEDPSLLDKTNQIAIIDHHRRSPDFIQKSILTFHEVYASSAAELVTELLQYTNTQVDLSKIEAEVLYAGIMMDTKNFTFKTGVRTFEAAAYLRKCGVDIIRVKKWFQSDLETYTKITEIIKTTEIINDTIGIAVYESEDKEANIICAKSADELLTIGNITASFVLGNDGEKVTISGRSIGDINVQLILEKMGGGGHITLAGAQIEGMTIEQVKQELKQRINEYFEENSCQ
ncbi:MAG TPA: phosphoesterase [Clostridiales bacterium]|nr:phosphoesterase [Clostridiales bacterium]